MKFFKNFLGYFIVLFIFAMLIVVCLVLPAVLAVNFDNAWWTSLYILTVPIFVAFVIAMNEADEEENDEWEEV